MTENDLTKICAWVSNGAKLYIGRDHAGRSRIKIVRGPFGLLTDRFKCDDRDIVELNRRVQVKALQRA